MIANPLYICWYFVFDQKFKTFHLLFVRLPPIKFGIYLKLIHSNNTPQQPIMNKEFFQHGQKFLKFLILIVFMDIL